MVSSDGGNQDRPKSGLPTALAVDDVHLSLLMIKEALKDIVNLYIASSATDALKVLGLVHVDLLLLDLGMPGMNGFEFIKQMRTMPNYENTPIIIVSSNAKQSALDKSLNYGVADYVIKPFQTPTLREKVLKVLTAGG